MPKKDDIKLSSSSFLSGIGALIAVASAASVIFSMSIELGYLFPFDVSLITLFSIQDIVSNALNILPFLIVAAFVLSVVEYTVLRYLAASKGKKTFEKWNRQNGFKFYLVLIGGILAMILLSSNGPVLGMLLLIGLAWLYLSTEVLPHFVGSRYRRVAMINIGLIPLLLVLAFGSGMQIGYGDLMSKNNNSILHFSNGKDTPAFVLARLDRGILFLEKPDARVIYARWETIDGFSAITPVPSSKSLLCAWAGLGCTSSPKPQVTAPPSS